MTVESIDRGVRVFVYEHILAEARPPTAGEVAAALSLVPPEVEASFRRLEEGHVLVFAPGTRSILSWWDNIGYT